MKDWIDFYETLQVHPKAGKKVIKAAYGELIASNNPNICKEPLSEEEIKRIDLAYEVLMDDRRREIFHEDWVENEKVVKKSKDEIYFKKNRQSSEEDLKAENCLKLYYGCIERDDFNAAYKYILEYEKGFIRKKEFVEWKKAAAEISKISDIRIKEFKVHKSFESRPGRLNYNAYEFAVSLLEKNDETGKISPKSFTKIVIMENGEYRVLLGHDSLRPVINKLKTMAEMKHNKNALSRFQEYESKYDSKTGLMNKKGFLDEAKKEEVRFNRYGRIFSILFIDCSHRGTVYRKDELLHFIIAIIKRNIRNIDMLAKWGEGSFVLLMPEIETCQAEKVAEKLRRLFENEEIYIDEKVVKVRIRTGVSEYNRHSIMETVYKAQVEKKIYRNNAKSS